LSHSFYRGKSKKHSCKVSGSKVEAMRRKNVAKFPLFMVAGAVSLSNGTNFIEKLL